MNFLNNLDYLLNINKMSRAELARTIGIAPSTINAWYTKDYKGIEYTRTDPTRRAPFDLKIFLKI